MNLLKFSALTIAIAASGSVDAMTTYTLHLEGTALHFFSPYECPDGPIGEDGNCVPPQETRPWRGTLELTAPDGDGTYLHNGMNLALTLSESTGMFYPSGHFLLSYPSTSGRNLRRPSRVAGRAAVVVSWLDLSDRRVPADSHLDLHRHDGIAIEENPFTGLTRSFGVITAAVPEPQTWALLLWVLLRSAACPKAGRSRRECGGCPPTSAHGNTLLPKSADDPAEVHG
jgi:hypothetical protein